MKTVILKRFFLLGFIICGQMSFAQRQTFTPLNGSDLLYDGMKVIIAANPTTYYTTSGNSYTPLKEYKPMFANIWDNYGELQYSGAATIESGKFIDAGDGGAPIVFILHKFNQQYSLEIAEGQKYAGEFLDATGGYGLPNEAVGLDDARRFEIAFPAGRNGAQMNYILRSGEKLPSGDPIIGTYVWTKAESGKVCISMKAAYVGTVPSTTYNYMNFTLPQICAVDPERPMIDDTVDGVISITAPIGFHLWVKPEISSVLATNDNDDEKYYLPLSFYEYKIPELFEGETLTLHIKAVDPQNRISSEPAIITINGNLGVTDVAHDQNNGGVEYFTIGGQSLDSENLTPSFYIRRDGENVTLIKNK